MQSYLVAGINRERSITTTSLCSHWLSHVLLRKGRSACLLPTRHSVQLWRPPGVNNNSEECKSHSGHTQVHAQIVSTMAPPPWHAPQTGNGMPIDPPSSSNLKSSSLLLEMYFRGWPFTTECVSPSNRPNVLTHVASYIHTVVRQRDPLRKVSQPHPRWVTGVA